jgi:hypothetical protein
MFERITDLLVMKIVETSLDIVKVEKRKKMLIE